MTLQETQEEVAEHLDVIKSYFKPGAKVMILIGFPPDPQGNKDFMMGDLGPQDVMDMAARQMAAARVQG